MDSLKSINTRCLVYLVLFLSFFIKTTLSDILPSILWAPYNPFFRFLGNSPRTVFLQDQLIFICPNKIDYPVQRSGVYNTDILHANLYMVDKTGYDNCNATGGKYILLCDNPIIVKHSDVRILKDPPLQSMPEFQPGKLHYFVDTSIGTKDNVSNLVGGKCRTHNMRMKLYVCSDKSDPLCPSGNKVTNGGWSSWQECSKSGTQTRQCNNPIPSNGGLSCQGNHITACTVTNISPTPTVTVTPSNNDTMTPKKDKRTSVADTLGTLSVGAVVGIFLAIFISGCILGLLVGVAAARIKSRGTVMRRRKGNLDDHFNRDSIASARNSRPFSTISNDTTLTSVTGFVSYNDIYNEVQ